MCHSYQTVEVTSSVPQDPLRMRRSLPLCEFPQNFCHTGSHRLMLPGCWLTAPHMLCCKLFSLLSFHIFKGSLKAISVTIVSCSSCITSAKLSVMEGLPSDELHQAWGQTFPVWSRRSTGRRSLHVVSLNLSLLTPIQSDPSAL